MSALRTQNKLAMAAWQSMKDSYAANEEVAAVRAQLAAIIKGTLPPDVVTAANALDAKLATLGAAGGRGLRGGGGGGGFGGGPARVPGSVLTFYSINGTFNTVLASLAQNGIDMPPSKAQVDTWESGCGEFTSTLSAWKTMLSGDLLTFNALLMKNNLTPLKIIATPLVAPPSCAFVPPRLPPAGGRGGRQ
jgi:hypothetical protein